jgi:prepilin-type N-terminal cleavage/methylation domain-containing protein
MQRMTDSRHNRAVTLIEMLVVLGIIVVLAGIVVTVTLRVDSQSKENTLQNAFAVVKSALRECYEATGGFPLQPVRNSTRAAAHVESMMQQLLSVPASRQVLEKLSPALVRMTPAGQRQLCDPWGTALDYVYVYDDKLPEQGSDFPELISAGPDKMFGTADDISSRGRS